MTGTTRVAVLGLGYWGPNLVRNFHGNERARLRVVCDARPERAAAAARAYPGSEPLTDAQAAVAHPEVDAVVLATPVDTHFPLAKAAIAAGKHVLVEKPLAACREHAEELIELARRAGVVLMVDHVFLYTPAVRKIKEIVDRGDLGPLTFINSVRVNLGQFQNDVNVVWDLAPHDLAIVDYVVGRLPRSISVFGAAHKDRQLEDVAYVNLDFGEGLIAGFHVSWLSPIKVRQLTIGGADRCLVYNDVDPVEKIKVYDSSVQVRPANLEDRRRLLVDYRSGDVWSPHLDRGEALQEVVAHFLDCIESGATPLTDGEAGLRVVRILEAAQQSIKAQGGRITL
ncbi:MAG TPA: Gfo/Idh/MocA family oxidoreductase [Thermoanaerobaculia bacterium]|nr:Gfo/Idh/MocA family oxidoreductase [Thermoanaerobaculia bacterium]HXT51424.1 Gfo/Idh/MocA family oxidoreductase [Thermoanaerobaculia bacterium]